MTPTIQPLLWTPREKEIPPRWLQLVGYSHGLYLFPGVQNEIFLNSQWDEKHYLTASLEFVLVALEGVKTVLRNNFCYSVSRYNFMPFVSPFLTPPSVLRLC